MTTVDQRFVDDVNRIVPAKPTTAKLDPVIYPLPIGTGMGTGTDSQAGIGGWVSPLSETQYADRQFYTAVNTTSSDGLFVFSVSRLKKIKMLDANGVSVVLQFDNKP